MLNAEYGVWFGPMALDSPEAQLLRQNLALQKEHRQPKLLDPPPSERIKTRLAWIEGGQTEQWVSLVWDLTLEPTSQVATVPGSSLTCLPGGTDACPSVTDRSRTSPCGYVN